MSHTQIKTNQTLTGAWTDLGPVLHTVGYSFITVGLDVVINDSKNVQIKLLAAVETIGNFHMPLSTVKKDVVQIRPDVRELDLDEDQKQTIGFEIDDTLDEVQLQVRALTPGITPAVIVEAFYTPLGYRQ